jgi:hypothetical protein
MRNICAQYYDNTTMQLVSELNEITFRMAAKSSLLCGIKASVLDMLYSKPIRKEYIFNNILHGPCIIFNNNRLYSIQFYKDGVPYGLSVLNSKMAIVYKHGKKTKIRTLDV